MIKKLKNYKHLIFLIILIITILLIIVKKLTLTSENRKFEANDIIVNEEELIKKEEDNKKIKVDIKGEIINPGVYELNEGERVIDAVNKAGGFTDLADSEQINLSLLLKDEMVIIVNSKINDKENIQLSNDANIKENTSLKENELININNASLELLMTLTGIGETKAKKIIEYRSNKKFDNIEEIKEVSGIGESIYNKIKTYICI